MNSPRSGYPEIDEMKDLEKYFEDEEQKGNYKITIPEDYKITHIGDIHGAYDLVEDIGIYGEKCRKLSRKTACAHL